MMPERGGVHTGGACCASEEVLIILDCIFEVAFFHPASNPVEG